MRGRATALAVLPVAAYRAKWQRYSRQRDGRIVGGSASSKATVGQERTLRVGGFSDGLRDRLRLFRKASLKIRASCAGSSSFRTHVAALLILATAANAYATSPCSQVGLCIDEASAQLVSWVDVMSERCAKVDPAKASEYTARREKLLDGADEPRGFLARLRASGVYDKARSNVGVLFDKSGEADRKQSCDAYLSDAALSE